MEVSLSDRRQRRRRLPAIYLLATLVIGLSVMIAEISMGRAAKANPITTLQQLSPKKACPGGWLRYVSPVLILLVMLKGLNMF
jgi:NSS family neurotransmitter:Na+ symporter